MLTVDCMIKCVCEYVCIYDDVPYKHLTTRCVLLRFSNTCPVLKTTLPVPDS